MTTKADFEVVPDSLRRLEDRHRGKPTNPAVLALAEGKTVRIQRNPYQLKQSAERLGFELHWYLEARATGTYVVWATKKGD